MADEPTPQIAGLYGSLRESHEPRLNALDLLVPDASPLSGYYAFDVTHAIVNWGMDGNDRWGDCGFAALDHYNVAKTGNTSLIGKFGTSKYPSLIAAYWAYGIAQGEPGPEPDQGVDNATVLRWAVEQGFIYGYAEVPPNYLDWFAAKFGGAILGLAIDGKVASADFEASPRRPWDVMSKIDGHDTLYVKSPAVAPGEGTLVTWGGLQPFTVAFRENNITDAWVIFDKYDPLVNAPALEAALASLPNYSDNPPTAKTQLAEGFVGHVEQDVKKIVHDLDARFDGTWRDVETLIEESVKKALPVILSHEFEAIAEQLLAGTIAGLA